MSSIGELKTSKVLTTGNIQGISAGLRSINGSEKLMRLLIEEIKKERNKENIVNLALAINDNFEYITNTAELEANAPILTKIFAQAFENKNIIPAFYCLVNVKSKDAVSFLLDKLKKEEDPKIREDIAFATLPFCRDPKIIPQLIEALKNEKDNGVRIAVLYAIRECKIDQAAPLLDELIEQFFKSKPGLPPDEIYKKWVARYNKICELLKVPKTSIKNTIIKAAKNLDLKSKIKLIDLLTQ